MKPEVHEANVPCEGQVMPDITETPDNWVWWSSGEVAVMKSPSIGLGSHSSLLWMYSHITRAQVKHLVYGFLTFNMFSTIPFSLPL